MCGIALRLACTRIRWTGPTWLFPLDDATEDVGGGHFPTEEQLMGSIKGRGPDGSRAANVETPGRGELSLLGSTLALRGDKDKVLCPLADDEGNLLVFNGEIFSDASGHDIDSNENDAQWLLKRLSDICSSCPVDDVGWGLLNLLDSLRGPWSLIFWSRRLRKVFFGRDIFGRRSLVLDCCFSNGLWVSSTAPVATSPLSRGQNIIELPTAGLYVLHFSEDSETVSFDLHARKTHRLDIEEGRLPRGGPLSSIANLSFLPDKMLYVPSTHTDSYLDSEFFTALRNAVVRRLVGIESHSAGKVGLLFSGGLDSMVLAGLLAKFHCGVVELINVSFGVEPSPDRLSALEAFKEIQEIAQRRSTVEFRLVLVDVTEACAQEHLTTIRDLLLPASTPMDFSIGSALWFAARGVGHIAGSQNEYKVQSKVLLSGLGADELLAGYKGRHRKVHSRSGAEGLMKELDADLSRLWWRNLGRDDRVVASHGRELRHPFLDEVFVEFCHQVDSDELFDLSLPDGEGDKMALRNVAKVQLGFSEASYRRSKKAMQFGSNSKRVVESHQGQYIRDFLGGT